MTLQAAADELYGLPPEQFTAARDDFAARLRRAGERELATAVRELRRPSVSAWLVNLLVRHRAEQVDRLLELGEQLRGAMANAAGEELRRLTDDRRSIVATLTADARALAEGRPVASDLLDEVAATLEAATADPTATMAVRSGRLVRPLRYAGFGQPDLAGAVGLAPAGSVASTSAAGRSGTVATSSATRGSPAERAAAERAAHEAAGAADDAQRAYEQRLAEHADAEALVDAAAEAVRAAADRLQQAENQLGTARQAETESAEAAVTAREAARAAHAAADTARARLAELRSATPARRAQ